MNQPTETPKQDSLFVEDEKRTICANPKCKIVAIETHKLDDRLPQGSHKYCRACRRAKHAEGWKYEAPVVITETLAIMPTPGAQ